MNWSLVYNGLPLRSPNCVWAYRGEMSLTLSMFSPEINSLAVHFWMSRTPPEIVEPWADIHHTEDFLKVSGKSADEFEQLFRGQYPHFPLPDDLKEKYDEILKEKLRFMKEIGLTRY